jgi:transposase
MAKPESGDPKVDALRKRGCLHPHADRVRDDAFASGEFFDPRDVVQVKYEMLRRVRVDGSPVSRAATDFGFSRPSFYHAQDAFEQGGLAALVPRKPGPRRAHKLNEEVVDFVVRALEQDDSLRSPDLAVLVLEEFGLTVHPRSIERALKRREKKRP